MENRIHSLIQNWKLNEPSTKDALIDLQNAIGFAFPVDYSEFLLHANGGEGPVGNNGYVVLWKIEDFIPWNEGYGVSEFAPGLLIFGSDGGDTAYAFDSRFEEIRIVEVPFIGMDLSEVKSIGKSFIDFLDYVCDK